MLAVFRRHLNAWYVRVFFVMLIGTFVLWGVGDVVRNLADDGSVATVAGVKIQIPEVQDAYRRQLAQVTRMFGGKLDTTPQMRRGIAAQAVEQVVAQTALKAAVSDMGIAVPDEDLRKAVYDIAAFRGANGVFDRTQFDTLLRNNGYTEAHFLDLVRAEQGQRQLMEAVRAGVISPDILTRAVYAFQQEKRVADAVDLPFSAAPPPPAPTEAQLTRWYENHKDLYSTPEMRRIKAVVLAPDTVEHDLQVSDDDLKAAYEQHRAEYNVAEKRSVQVLLAQDEATARTLAGKWNAGADWAAMQAAGATPAELTDATAAEFPAPELGQAVFAAPEGAVAPPVHSALGWHVFKVTKIVPGNVKTFAQVRDTLRAQVLADKAADLIYDRAGKIEDLLAGGTAIDDLPGDVGLAAVAGTMDAQGMTQAGTPAPIPGPASLAQALVQAAFQMKKGDPAHLTEAPAAQGQPQSYFAVTVDEITPPAPRPMAEVEAKVTADFTHDAIRHEQETAAAGILAAVKSGKSFTDAAAGDTIRRLPPIGRASGADGVPLQLVDPLFTLKPGEPTMVETADGFTVAVLATIQTADPDADPIGYGQVRDALAKAVSDDVQTVLTIALRDRAKPRVNASLIDQIAQPDQQ